MASPRLKFHKKAQLACSIIFSQKDEQEQLPKKCLNTITKEVFTNTTFIV